VVRGILSTAKKRQVDYQNQFFLNLHAVDRNQPFRHEVPTVSGARILKGGQHGSRPSRLISWDRSDRWIG
jgi:hypothetical protein